MQRFLALAVIGIVAAAFWWRKNPSYERRLGTPLAYFARFEAARAPVASAQIS